MKEALNYSWSTKQFTIEQNPHFLEMGVFLWIFDWDAIPHLGMSKDGKYFSSTIRGIQKNEDSKKFWRLAEFKNTPLFVMLLNTENINLIELDRCFQTSISVRTTCLEPIKLALSVQDDAIEIVSDLIKILSDRKCISQVIANSINSEGTIFLNRYNKADVLALIHQKIAAL